MGKKSLIDQMKEKTTFIKTPNITHEDIEKAVEQLNANIGKDRGFLLHHDCPNGNHVIGTNTLSKYDSILPCGVCDSLREAFIKEGERQLNKNK